MSDFLDKAKSMVTDLKDKVEDAIDSVHDKLPEGVKSKVDDVRTKADGLLGDHAAPAEPAAD